MYLSAFLIEHNRYMNFIGIALVLLLCYFLSQNRQKISLGFILKALGLQFLIGAFVLRTKLGESLVAALANGIRVLYSYAEQGSAFVFGSLIDASQAWGFIFAFKVLPIILFFAALTSILFYWGIIQKVVFLLNKFFEPILKTTGPETLCAVANSFLGQTESPLLIKNYLPKMTRSEIFVVMVSGMATISGGILAAFAAMGVPARHMLAASLMAIPASILIAKLLIPSESENDQDTNVKIDNKSTASNFFDALAAGTFDGLNLALNVGAALIVFTALLNLVDAILHGVGSIVGYYNLGLKSLFGFLFAPLGYLLGLTGPEAQTAGQLLGIKISANELLAYQQMLSSNLSERAIVLLTYALCGFSNFSCIGIQVAGIGAIAPSRRVWLSQLGVRAVLASSLANLLSAFVAGIIL
jgi:CNT family concentrative nucleoside transporter